MTRDHKLEFLEQIGGVSSLYIFLLIYLCTLSGRFYLTCFFFLVACVHQIKGLSDILKTNIEKGIYGDDADLLKRKNAFGSNTYPQKKGRSFWVIAIADI